MERLCHRSEEHLLDHMHTLGVHLLAHGRSLGQVGAEDGDQFVLFGARRGCQRRQFLLQRGD